MKFDTCKRVKERQALGLTPPTKHAPYTCINMQHSLRTTVANSGGPWGQRIVVGVARSRQQAEHEVESPSHASLNNLLTKI